MAPRGQSWQDIWLTSFKRPHNHTYEGRSVAEVALMREQHPVDALCDLLIVGNCGLGGAPHPRRHG